MITTTFNPPTLADTPTEFNTKAFDFASKLNVWATEVNQTAEAISADEVAAQSSATTAAIKAGESLVSSNTAVSSAAAASTYSVTANNKAAEASASALAAQGFAASAALSAAEALAITETLTTPIITPQDEGKLLTVRGGAWAVEESQAIKNVSTNYTVQASDNRNLIRVSAAAVLTIPSAFTTGYSFSVYNSSTAVVTLSSGAHLVDGVSTVYVYPNERFQVVSVGLTYITIGRSKVLTLPRASGSGVAMLSFSQPFVDQEIVGLQLELYTSESIPVIALSGWTSMIKVTKQFGYSSFTTSQTNVSGTTQITGGDDSYSSYVLITSDSIKSTNCTVTTDRWAVNGSGRTLNQLRRSAGTTLPTGMALNITSTESYDYSLRLYRS